MSNIRAITSSSKIVHRNQGGGSKKQGIASSTNLSMWSHVAFRNRNVVCPCHRHHVFCMNQLGGVGAGGVPGNSYMFAPSADGINKNKILCGVNHKNILNPSQWVQLYKANFNIIDVIKKFEFERAADNLAADNLAAMTFLSNNINIIDSISLMSKYENTFSDNFYLINGHGKITNPNDLIGKEYIIFGYYNDKNLINHQPLITLHFKLIEFNILHYYNIEWFGNKKPQHIDIIIKEIYVKK